jgi:adenylosuccinate synthase
MPSFTHGMLEEAGFAGQVVDLGITRAYSIRHGAGPMPTDNPEMSERLLPGSNKDENRYQGKVRVGPLDLVLLRYALAACGGSTAFDGLAITWFDQIVNNGSWQICSAYAGADNPEFYLPSGEIRVGGSEEHQAALAEALLNCTSEVLSLPIETTASQDDLYGVCAGVFEKALDVPVRMVSFGPTELDKLCK